MTWYDWAAGWIRWDSAQLSRIEDQQNLITGKVNAMADVLDKLKADFEAYQEKVTTTLTDLKAKVAALTTGALDPAKAQTIDDEITAATNALAPPAA